MICLLKLLLGKLIREEEEVVVWMFAVSTRGLEIGYYRLNNVGLWL